MGYGENFWIYCSVVVFASLALNWQEVDVSLMALMIGRFLEIFGII